MKVVLVCQKNEFDSASLAALKKQTSVVWYDSDITDLNSVSELFDSDEKILALSPAPINWTFPQEIYPRLNNIKAICLVTTDYSYVDLDWFKREGILVTNIPHYATEAVAENAIFMMMALLRRLPILLKSGFKYQFTDQNLADEYQGKTAGIIGLGDIGRRIATITQKMGMKTIYWSRHQKGDFEYQELNSLLSQSDIIFPALIANSETDHFLNKELLSNIQDSAYFVSIVDQSIYDKDYLIDRIKKHRLAGLAFEINNDHEKITDYDGNVLPLPSLGWYTRESLDNNIQIWTNNILSVLRGQPQNLCS